MISEEAEVNGETVSIEGLAYIEKSGAARPVTIT